MNIRKKILASFTVFALASCPAALFSEKKGINVFLGFHGGQVFTLDDTMSLIYGSDLLTLGLFLRASLGKNFALDVTADWITETGKPLSEWGTRSRYGLASMTIVPFQVSGIIGLDFTRDFCPYVGAGIGFYNFEETLTVFGISETASESTTGFHLLGGVHKMWKFIGIKSEFRYSSATIKGLQGNINIGGFSILWGLMVRFEV